MKEGEQDDDSDQTETEETDPAQNSDETETNTDEETVTNNSSVTDRQHPPAQDADDLPKEVSVSVVMLESEKDLFLEKSGKLVEHCNKSEGGMHTEGGMLIKAMELLEAHYA